MVDGELNRERPGVRHQAVGRLVPHRAAPRTGDAHRTALVPAHRQVGFAHGNQGRASGRRAAGRSVPIPRVPDRAGHRRVTPAREAQVLAHRLAGDRRAGREQPGHHGRVPAGHEALQGARAVHHRHAGDLDVVLDRDPAPGQRPVGPLGDLGPHVPGAQRVPARVRLLPRPVSGWLRRRLRVQLLDRVVGRQQAGHHGLERAEILVTQMHPVPAGDRREVVFAGRTDSHGGLPGRVGFQRL